MIWNIILRKANGEYVRYVQSNKPDKYDLSYLEAHYVEKVAGYDMNAVVINIFEVGE